MLQLLSKVNIVDNSGVLKGRVIKILTPKNTRIGKLGGLIIISSKIAIKNSGILPGSKFKALIIRTKSKSSVYPYSFTNNENAVVLVKAAPKNDEYLPVATRIKGPISNNLFRLSGYQKVLALAKYVI